MLKFRPGIMALNRRVYYVGFMVQEKERLIAWQGFEVIVPANWDLDVVSGDDRNGYFQISDGMKSAIEVRWNNSRKRPSLDKVLDRYGKLLHKGRRRLPQGTTLERKSDFLPEEREDRAGFVIQMEGSGRVYGFGAYTEQSKRVMMVQVSGVSLSQVRRMFSELKDRWGEPGWNHWAIYDLDITLPEGFKLQNRRLVAGYVYLHFTQKGREYAVERWGPASEIMRGRTLQDFIVESKACEGTVIRETTPIDVPHPGLLHKGRRPLRWQKNPKGLSRFWKAWECAMWECDVTNRVYAQHYFHSRRDEGWVDEVRLLCHTAQ